MDIKKDVNLSRFCNYGTGGNASFFAMPETDDDLKTALLWAKENGVEFEVIGGGCNVLISDNGYHGLIISTAELNCGVSWFHEAVVCGAGVNLIELINFAISNSLKGYEALAGIPGTVGGAVKMNAGAYGVEIKDCINRVSAMDKEGNRFELTKESCGFGYRKSSGLENLIVVSADFIFKRGDKSELLQIKKDTLAKRKEKQPLNKPSCGSVFKRPEGGFAGVLIEECGLKGLRKGGAVVSEKHANFILNDSGATSADIKFIIDTIVATVFNEKGVRLEPEVKFIGF